METSFRIAILGWGSLISNPGRAAITSGWAHGGPVLPIEFSRVSRDGRLTLVIDPDHGVAVPTRYAESVRATLEDAISDLGHREGTVAKNIGFLDLVNVSSRSRHAQTLEAVRAWARSHDFAAVVWTDLPGNFAEKTGIPFSAKSAVGYLGQLLDHRATAAREYVEGAPAEVDTPVRRLASAIWRKAADSRGVVPPNPGDIADHCCPN